MFAQITQGVGHQKDRLDLVVGFLPGEEEISVPHVFKTKSIEAVDIILKGLIHLILLSFPGWRQSHGLCPQRGVCVDFIIFCTVIRTVIETAEFTCSSRTAGRRKRLRSEPGRPSRFSRLERGPGLPCRVRSRCREFRSGP
ncbi:hypothetical protein SDC9_165984 [bioreactor metagenome]|uniref:Uncharacterized protein n=1 Tax=bioreactor metagenome TaxID=1076179 RepID=A0A645G3L2_9ZZZZ